MALARQLLDRYAGEPCRRGSTSSACWRESFDPDPSAIGRAWDDYRQDASPRHLQGLLEAVEPPRQELFRRLNLAPGGTAALVAMREDLIKHGGRRPGTAQASTTTSPTCSAPGSTAASWCCAASTGRRPADILERIIRYEAVHEIQGWDDLRRRVQPPDRRCFAFFHPSLVDEPLIFVEVALTREIPARSRRCSPRSARSCRPSEATTAVFYSISNCQPGPARASRSATS